MDYVCTTVFKRSCMHNHMSPPLSVTVTPAVGVHMKGVSKTIISEISLSDMYSTIV